MKATVYRPHRLEGHGSWRPLCLTDDRGPVFPDEYEVVAILAADGLEHACEQYASELGDVILLGEGEDAVGYAAGPFNWELVKFGGEWRSPRRNDAR